MKRPRQRALLVGFDLPRFAQHKNVDDLAAERRFRESYQRLLKPRDCAEWDCEGCGDHVVSYGRTTVPSEQLCAVCNWMNAHLSPTSMMERRKAMGLLKLERKST